MKTILPCALVLVGHLALTGCGPDGSAQQKKPAEQVRQAAVPIQRIVGSYRDSDGIKTITISEVFSEDGWNGKLSFSPAAGDWATPVRCRVSGTDLVVELPIEGRPLIKMFRLDSPTQVTGLHEPWKGAFVRVR